MDSGNVVPVIVPFALIGWRAIACAPARVKAKYLPDRLGFEP